MFKKLLFLFAFFIVFSVNSQNKAYFDSIQKLESTISPKEYLKTILDIPYDIAVSNVKNYEILSRNALTIATQLNDSISIAESYNKLALALHFSSKDAEALDATIKAANIFEKLNKLENVGDVYLNLGWRLKNRDLNKAFFYMQSGLKTIEKVNPNSIKLIGGYNNFGVLHQYKNQLDSAFYFHHKSLSLTKIKNDSIGIPFAYTHIAYVYLKQQQFTLAKKYLDSSLTIREKRNDLYGITDTYLYYGDLYFAKKDFKSAIEYYQKGYTLSKTNNYFPLKKYTVTQLYKAYDSIKDYRNSLLYFKELSIIKDSVINTTTNAKIAELEIEFQTEKKEKEINKQQLEIKNKNIFTILLSAILLIIIIISYALYKKQQYKRKQLQREIHLKDALAKIQTQNRLQEQRLRISRDLHDNIGSQLTFIISSIDNLKYISKDANENLKNKLSSISSFTSDTIFQLRDTIWAMNKSEITFEDLHTRILSFIEKAKTATNKIAFEVDNKIASEFSFTSIVGIHIFRVVQEAINNAIKHADASEIKVSMSEKGKNIHVTVADNGKGFDLKETQLGNGLTNIEKRISDVNGKVSINSTKEKGTTISITITK